MKHNWIYYVPLAGFILYFLEYYAFPYNRERGKKASFFIFKHFAITILITLIYCFLIK